MRPSNVLRLLPVVSRAAALQKVDCSGNVTIANATDAKAANSCSTIKGSLLFHKNLNGSIVLDGVKKIKGGLEYQPCIYDLDDPETNDCPSVSPFNISLPSLKEIGGQILFNYAPGLRSLDLSQLTNVGETFRLNYTTGLTSLDITKLEYTGALSLTCPALIDLSINRLKGFSEHFDNGGWVNLGNLGKVSNIDGLLAYPLEAVVRGTDPPYNLTINERNVPFVRDLTIGWSNIEVLEISGVYARVTLGPRQTGQVFISNLTIGSGITSLTRYAMVDNLTVDSMTVLSGNDFSHLRIPFTSLKNLEIQDSPYLGSIEIPSDATNWTGANFTIKDCPKLMLDEINTDNSKTQWHWPQKMKALTIHGNMSSAFFKDFISENVEVTETFDISDLSKSLNCSIFDAMPHGSLPSNASCKPEAVETPQPLATQGANGDDDHGSGASSTVVNHQLILLMAAMTLFVA